jgi:hypothetical protein
MAGTTTPKPTFADIVLGAAVTSAEARPSALRRQ